jgi:predicted Rdx family selenoprotein
VTGDKGVFDVRVDEDLIYSKDETGRHGEPSEMVDVVRGILEA